MYELDFNPEAGIFRCMFHGRLDTVASLQLAAELDAKYSELSGSLEKDGPLGFRVVFDLKDVNFISSTFIRLCVAAKKRALDGDFSIKNTDPFIKKTFKIAGLDEILNVE